MNEPKEKTITLTENELKATIRDAVIEAVHYVESEKDLDYNQKREQEESPALFTLLKSFCIVTFIIIELILILGIAYFFIAEGINVDSICGAVAFLALSGLSICCIREIWKTNKMEHLNAFYSVIFTLLGLIIALVSAVFAFKALPNNDISSSTEVVESVIDRSE